VTVPDPGARGGGRLAWATAGIVVAISLLSTFTLATPRPRPRPAAVGTETVVEEGPGGGGGETVAPGATPTGGGATRGPSTVGGVRHDCSRGQNAGATEVGVTAREIRLAATVVKSGIARTFLADAQFGMEAVRTKVNRAGGICGRVISIVYKDDGWVPSTGQRIIRGFIGENRYFGLAVNPSSEGLRGAIDSGTIRESQFPVVGADGQLIDQYQDPWVWPVATSTASVMHIMAHDAYRRGARTFGIAWEQNYRFGVEGHAAFVGAVRRLGGTVTSDVALEGGRTSYSNEVDRFIGGCGGVDSLSRCDFIAMLLEPATAGQWVRDGGLGDGVHRPRIGIGAPQPLFLDSFARDCGLPCANLWVWTSFKPPIAPYDTDPRVVAYRRDLAAVSATADPNNPHVQGAYVGMLLLVEALERLGPAPTRAGIREVLDAMILDTGLAPPLRFRPGDHFAATAAQAFEAVVNQGSFTGWRYTNSGFVADPEVGKDIPS
jgi:ABC-type branched-subunit amino acid transport system substrate-binding protein